MEKRYAIETQGLAGPRWLVHHKPTPVWSYSASRAMIYKTRNAARIAMCRARKNGAGSTPMKIVDHPAKKTFSQPKEGVGKESF
jgi:hypothetical protein